MNYSYVRFTTGDAIVAEVLGSYLLDETVTLVKPLTINTDITPRGQEVVVYPWMPLTSCEAKSVVIKSTNILFVTPVIDKVSEYFIKYANKLYDQEPRTPEFKEISASKLTDKDEGAASILERIMKSGKLS